MKERTTLVVEVRVAGFHRWCDAPEPYKYLRAPHRHTFVVQAEVEVFHSDREIEINALADRIENYLDARVPAGASVPTGPVAEESFAWASCETLAEAVAQFLLASLPQGSERYVKVVVLEDGIHGGAYERSPE